MTRTISMLARLAAVASLAGCSGLMGDRPSGPTTAPATLAGACEAMRPALPIGYHGGKSGLGGGLGEDTPGTVTQVKDANARFKAACP